MSLTMSFANCFTTCPEMVEPLPCQQHEKMATPTPIAEQIGVRNRLNVHLTSDEVFCASYDIICWAMLGWNSESGLELMVVCKALSVMALNSLGRVVWHVTAQNKSRDHLLKMQPLEPMLIASPHHVLCLSLARTHTPF